MAIKRKNGAYMNRHLYKQGLIFSTALLSGLFAIAQSNVTDILQQQFTRYQQHALQEKIFVHTDKSFYLVGEMLWFKLYTVDESFNKPLGISKVAYVEIISEEQKPVLQAKIALEEGMGNGSLLLPNSLASGTYKLRAYTSRMKNFGPDYFYEQSLTVVNTLKATAIKEDVSNSYHIDFFPEGGNMVNGIPAVLAFKITDQYGNGINANGYLLGAKKDTINKLQTDGLGMGSFSVTPQKDAIFQAAFTLDGNTVSQNLPQGYSQGYTMALSEEAGSITVTVNASSNLINLPVYIFVHTKHVVKEVKTAQLTNGKTVFNINKSKLGEGISHITVFNADRQPVCERLYFKRPANKLQINSKTDQAAYASRNRINISVQATDKTGTPAAADMSAAVFMIDSLQPASYEDIHAWLLLQSELPGRIPSPAYFFNDSSAAAQMALNHLLLTQGWRRFKWEDVLADKAPAFEFVTEHEGPVINGMLTDKKSGQPQANIITTLTVPGQHFELRSALSAQDGSVRFNINDFYSGNEMILQTLNASDSTVKVNVASPFSDKFSAAAFPRFTMPVQWKDLLLNRSINSQAENAYLVDKKRFAFASPVMDTNVFYGKAERQYYLDDYTRFITMYEVMREYVIEVRVRKPSDHYQFRVANNVYKSLFEHDPLVLIDGLPVTNLDKLMAFDPLKIKRVDVAMHKHFLGPLVSDGVVSYRTYEGDLGGYELDPHAVVIEYDGLQRQREFYSPVYETNAQKESRIPDLRNLLYWSPSVKTAADGKQQLSFYTSDLKAKFAVVVQGLTAEGLSGSSISTFSVDK